MADLVKQGTQTIAVPEFMREDAMEGKQDVDVSSIRLPRLAIAQGLSHEMVPDDSAYIDGLRLTDMFNNLTTEIYGRGPIKFIPIQHHVVRVEFDPQDRNIVLDRNVPANDPRCQWGEDPVTGKGIPPKATKYTEVGCLLIHDDRPPEPIVISIKETNKWQTKAAERLTMFIVNTPGPIYGSIKSVETKGEKNEKGNFGVFVIKNVRMLGKIGGVSSAALEGESLQRDIALYNAAKTFYNNIKGKTIDVNREGDDADTSFEPEVYETEKSTRDM